MPRLITCAALAGACLVGSADAFASLPLSARPTLQTSSAAVSRSCAASTAITMQLDRRGAITLGALAALGTTLKPSAADAAGVALGYAMTEKEMNEQLVAFGLKPFDKIPKGFKPLIQAVGGSVGANIDGTKTIESLGSLVTSNGGLKQGERLLVSFAYPGGWLVSLPITTPNGESGTVSSNNYLKGDSGVVTAKNLKEGETLEGLNNVFFQELLTQTLTQNQFQSFKVMKKTPAEPIDGQTVVDIEFKYDLLTQGGLAVGRHGFSRCIQCGPNVISLGVTTVDGRFKKVKDDILAMSKSFRANVVKAEFEKAGSSGIKVGTESEAAKQREINLKL